MTMSEIQPPRILIVEDEPINLGLIVETLKDCGFELLTAINSEEAISIALSLIPSLILLDIRIPGMNGFEVCKHLKSVATTKDIPIIFLTAVNKIEEKVKAFQIGGIDYITKPYEPAEVLARVILHLDQHQLYHRLQQQIEAYEKVGIPSTESLGLPPSEHANALLKVSDYLLGNLAHNPSLDELAELAATNRTTLNQDFQRYYGMTVFDWLREQRLLKAALLLRTTDNSVMDISHFVGFVSHAGFSTSFRQRFGVTPREYRSFTS